MTEKTRQVRSDKTEGSEKPRRRGRAPSETKPITFTVTRVAHAALEAAAARHGVAMADWLREAALETAGRTDLRRRPELEVCAPAATALGTMRTQLRLTAEEHAAVARCAQSAGVSVSALLVQAGLHAAVGVREEGDA